MKCEECKKRKAIITFSREPMSALIRGYGKIEICRHCYVEIIEKELISIEDNLKEQKKLLKKEEEVLRK